MTLSIQRLLLAILLCLSACGNTSKVNRDGVRFVSKEAATLKECIDDWKIKFDKKCSTKNYLFKRVIGKRNGFEITMIEQIWFEYIKKGQHSFNVIKKLVNSGSDILKISRSIVDIGSLNDFRALMEIGGGPNSLSGTGLAGGSLMHSTVELWQSDKIKYLLSQKPNLEQKNSDGETALLIARRSPFEISRIDKMTILIEHGAEISAVDNDGKGLCDFILLEKSKVRPEFLSEVNEFEFMLQSKGLTC